MKTYVSLLVLAAALSFFLTPLVRRIGVSRGLLDHPEAGRRSHANPVPRLGGVAIYASFVLTLGSLFLVHNFLTLNFQMQFLWVLKLLLPCTLIFLLGIYDDVWGANARIKFSVQIVASLLLYAFGFHITQIWNPFGGVVSLGIFALPLTVLWLVGISNAFNLIDGLDGLSAGAALFALLTVSIAALVYGHPIIVILAMSLAGATLGFLRYNVAPAQIFMGDSGSLFLGFTLAALSIEGSQKSAAAVAVAIPIASFGLPILDTFWTIFRRLLGRRPVFTGDLEHIHHMMLKRGLSNRQVIILLYAVCAAFALFSLLFLNPQGKIMGLALFAIGFCIFWGIQHLGYHEAHELTYAFGKVIRQRRTFARNIHLRRTISSLTEVQTSPDLFASMSLLLGSNDFDQVQMRIVGMQAVPETIQTEGTEDLSEARWYLSQEGPDLVWSWHRSGRQHAFHDLASHWKLQVPLTNKGVLLGEITFHRHLAREPLQLDTYYFCSLLQEELSQTFVRLQSHSQPCDDCANHGQAKASGT
ncbi:MAG: undecaprenyl/decaprenyl-phosphate alpha-N-acetylglucosaminyl 1-phosphate transferase [Acidobacteria bacterium]|nr:undecaprenyl/decaprenyl-phosphate alpha-N-acetylglucosaminyl 1-phosphate transferase [Acidobacteriota bacterium]